MSEENFEKVLMEIRKEVELEAGAYDDEDEVETSETKRKFRFT